jgi:hypothetical protein
MINILRPCNAVKDENNVMVHIIVYSCQTTANVLARITVKLGSLNDFIKFKNNACNYANTIL